MPKMFKIGFPGPLHFIPKPGASVIVYDDHIVVQKGRNRSVQPINATCRMSTSGSSVFGHSLCLDTNASGDAGPFSESNYTYIQNFSEFVDAVSAAIQSHH